MDAYNSLPENMKLSPGVFELLKMDWAGGEQQWPLREWTECLSDWLLRGSGFFQGYASLSARDQAVFDALKNVGQRIIADIEELKNTASESSSDEEEQREEYSPESPERPFYCEICESDRCETYHLPRFE